MASTGGETTQLGVLYQNKVTALYLGRMLDPRAINLPTNQQVVEVRGEKPGADVDDIDPFDADSIKMVYRLCDDPFGNKGFSQSHFVSNQKTPDWSGLLVQALENIINGLFLKILELV